MTEQLRTSKDRGREAVELLIAVRQSAPDTTFDFESLAAVLPMLPWYAKQWCLSLIRRTGAESSRVVAALIPLLADREPTVRRAAASVLGYCGDKTAVPFLQEVARSRLEHGRIRRTAMRSIGRLLGR